MEQDIAMPAVALLIALQLVTAAPPAIPVTRPATARAPRLARLTTVQVSATRDEKPVDATAASVDVVPAHQLRRGGPGVNLSEMLTAVPGVLARERQNYAQDLQVSIRGFGARATFGIRGIRVLQDGFPVTMPDGQGQASNLDLGGLDRIEVLRGPFSALYGNAAGGVLQTFSARGAEDPGLRSGIAAGGDGLLRLSSNLRGARGQLDYNLDAMHFRTDGYREHGAAQRDLFNAKLEWKPGGRVGIGVLVNALSAPTAGDPLGLTSAQWRADPRQAAPAALAFDTRKSLQHRMLGIDVRLGSGSDSDNQLRLMAYGGSRDVLQFLAVPTAAQTNPLSGGGVVDLASRFAGTEVRWTAHGHVAGGPFDAVLGLAADRQRQHRRGYENFLGTIQGVRGALRRDQRDAVGDVDQYAQIDWRPQPRLGVLLGVRHGVVRFDSDDNFIVPGNPDDSGQRQFAATTPVAGLNWRLRGGGTLYLSAGRGFETPTFDELAYRADGSAGLNFLLRAADSRSVEIGARAAVQARVQWQAAMFRADTDAELVVATNAGGRSAFQNAGRARRQGFEFTAHAPLARRWTGRLAWTWLDARFRDSFLTCGAGPCRAPVQPVAAGTPLPGLPRSQLFTSLEWQGARGLAAVLSVQAVGAVPVANAGAVRAPGYAVFDLELSCVSRRPGLPSASLRLGNLLDRHYVGSVIVNEANGRYFEPAPGRGLMLALDWTN